MRPVRFVTLSMLVGALSVGCGGSPKSTGAGGAGGEEETGGATGTTGGSSGGAGKSGTGGATPTGGAGGAGTGGLGGAAPTTGGSGGGGAGGNGENGGAGGAMGGAGGVVVMGEPLGAGNPMSTGLDRHDALYCGEWQKTTKPGDTIYLIKGGKVVWSYSLNTSGGNEFGDCTLTSYGTVFYPLKGSGAFEMKVDLAKAKGDTGDLVWSYKQDGGSEVHSVQPIGKDKVMVMQNGTPPKLMIIDKTKAKVCQTGMDCILKTYNPDGGGGTHGQFRHVRVLANGNFLVPYTGGGGTSKGHVKEYTPDWKVVWDYDSGGSPWAAVRLHNGNTLVSGNGGGWLREVGPDLKVVWELNKTDFPATMYLLQGAQRLKNGNTLVSNWCGPADTGQWANTVQYFEVTPDKKFVWQLKQWNNPNLGPGSSIQALDEPGTPENPGELQR